MGIGDGGSTFIGNVVTCIPKYTASHPRRYYFNKKKTLKIYVFLQDHNISYSTEVTFCRTFRK
jgi:hypothetical protein